MLQSKDLYVDILENPDKQDNESFNLNIESKYCNVKHTSNRLQVGDKGFSLLHCNIRSLNKNVTLLTDIFMVCKEIPSFIAISETKLKNDSISNISIDGYKFVAKHSQTIAGGVGIYIKHDIEFVRRHDIEFDFQGVETCFIEIPRKKDLCTCTIS